MTHQQMLQRLETAWGELQLSYEGLTEPELFEPGVIGAWSIKEIISHVTTWEEEALKYLPLILRGEKPPRYSRLYGGIDAFNALMTKKNMLLSLTSVLQQRDEIHLQLIQYLTTIPEGQILHESPFRHRLRLDTWSHYIRHAKAIQQWRQSR